MAAVAAHYSHVHVNFKKADSLSDWLTDDDDDDDGQSKGATVQVIAHFGLQSRTRLKQFQK